MNKKQVLEIYYSVDSYEKISEKYELSIKQIICLKRKNSYKTILLDINDPPGICSSRSMNTIPLSNNNIENIFLETACFDYFKKTYQVTPIVVKNIKSRKTYRNVTEGLGKPGAIKRYSLSDYDVENIRNSRLKVKELSLQYKVTQQTIRNIKNYITRKYPDIILNQHTKF